MSKVLDVSLGKHINTSSWGSGTINGVTSRNSLRVKEYDNGYVLEIMWLLGGGKLWLPKGQFTVVEHKQGKFLKQDKLRLHYKNHRITVYRALVKSFISV